MAYDRNTDPNSWCPPGTASFCLGCGVNARFGSMSFRCRQCLDKLFPPVITNDPAAKEAFFLQLAIDIENDKQTTRNVMEHRNAVIESNRAAGKPPLFWMLEQTAPEVK